MLSSVSRQGLLRGGRTLPVCSYRPRSAVQVHVRTDPPVHQFSTTKTPTGRSSKAPLPSQQTVSTKDPKSVHFSTVYVHPLSQVVLRHLQQSCHLWMVRRHLDRLVLHRDGTFSLEHSGVRIWTYYDGEDRKHWLSLSINNGKIQARHRFLLQDNNMNTWNNNKRGNSLVERIQESVKDLMKTVEEAEGG